MFTARLKQLRDTYRISQRELAEATKLPLSQINSIESGKSSPNLTALIRLSDYFDVTIDYLADRNEYPEKNPEKYILIPAANLNIDNIEYLYMYAGLSSRTNAAKEWCVCGCRT